MIPHNIPINGRIAIVDDQIKQATPLIHLFGKLQLPYVYYDGKVKNLPELGKACNDVRLLFLDVNLIDDTKRKDKELKSTLISVIDRIISEKNYPYLIILWSRQDNEYTGLIKEIFRTDKLKNKRPISFISANKQDYWDLNGNYINEAENPLTELFSKITEEINKFPVYGHLLNWENQIHFSADKTLEEIFKLGVSEDKWTIASNFVFYKLGLAYAGKTLKDSEAVEQIKSAFFSLNSVFIDSLEYSIGNNFKDNNYDKLEEIKVEDREILYTLNRKLLLSDDKEPFESPGLILKRKNDSEEADFQTLLNGCINRNIVKERIRLEDPEITENELKRQTDARSKALRTSIRNTWFKILLSVTPLCDFTQKKNVSTQMVRGIIIKSEYRECINTASESIFISPIFRTSHDNQDKILVLDFKHFISLKTVPKTTLTPLFRIRPQLMAEIQSKLSRHMNRQGVLFLD
jgi:hypothetical protein